MRNLRLLSLLAVLACAAAGAGSAQLARDGGSAQAGLGALVAAEPPLVPDDETGSSGFGGAVALSADGTTAVVGGTSARLFEGRAWILVRSADSWSLQAVLTPNDGTHPTSPFAHSNFGARVAISADGDTALVSAPGDHDEAGAAWVFVRSGGAWSQQGQKLVAPGAEPNTRFGTFLGLAADGESAVVGSGNPGHTSHLWGFAHSGSSWTSTGALLDDHGDPMAGVTSFALAAGGDTAFAGDGQTVRAFVRSGASWTQQGPPLAPSDGGPPAFGFGATLATSAAGDVLLAGNPGASPGTVTGVWLFRRSSGVWAQQGPRVEASPGTTHPGAALALSADGTRALIEADRSDNAGVAVGTYAIGSALSQEGVLTLADGSPPTGGPAIALSPDGAIALVGASNLVRPAEGGLWAFARNAENWAQLGSRLTEPFAAGDSQFGARLALSADGNTAAIAGPNDAGGSGNDALGAVWIYTRSGRLLVQSRKLQGDGSSFGRSVALSADGQTALAGSLYHPVTAMRRDGGTWSPQNLPRPPGLPTDNDLGLADFGADLALSGDGTVALVGAPRHDGFAGSAWVYTRSGSTWTVGPRLAGTGRTQGTVVTGSLFGTSVALSADGATALVGGKGGVWAFARDGSGWVQQGPKLASGEPFFGSPLALSSDGSVALVGAADESQSNVGSVWVYVRSNGVWTPDGPRLRPSGVAGSFGDSVALSADGRTALIGGRHDGANAGAAWLFQRSGGAWTQQGARLATAPAFAGLGAAVALSGAATTALVGAPGYPLRDGEPSGGVWLLTTDGPLPAAPTAVTAGAGRAEATVSFAATAGDGSYTVRATPGGQSASGAGSPITVTGLTAAVSYRFSVTATNAAGEGPASSLSEPVTPYDVPGAPTAVAAVSRDGAAGVSFTPGPANGRPVDYFTATATPGGQSASGTSSPIVVAGLANGTAYTFTVTATNAAGTGAASAASSPVVPVGDPRPHPDPPAEAPRPDSPSAPLATGPRPPRPSR